MKNKFNRVLNSSDVIVVAFGAMIGWGWVVSSGEWIQTAGVLGAILGFFLGGVMIYFVGLTYAELTTAMPKSGGEHIFSYRAFGHLVSFICTWSIILSYIGVVCFEVCSFPTIMQYLFPDFLKGYLYTVKGFDVYTTWLVLAIISSIFIIWINIVGVKLAAIFQKILTVTIALVGAILFIYSIINGSISNLDGQLFIGFDSISSFKNILSISLVSPFFLFGFDVIPQVAEEINVPLKKLGKLLVASIVLAVLFYACIVFSIGYIMNLNEISMSIDKGSLVSVDAITKASNSKVMTKILIIGGMCGIVTSWNSFLIGGSRALFSMAESYMIPNFFAKIHPKYKTPINSLFLIGIISIISPFFGREMLVWIANSASFACCVSYCIISMSFVILRKKEPNLKRPYKIKNYKFVGIVASLMSGVMIVMYIIPGTGSTLSIEEWVILLFWGILGVIFYSISNLKYKDKDCLNFYKLDSEFETE